MTAPSPRVRLIDRWEVIHMLGISESTLERRMVSDERFPAPRRLGARCTQGDRPACRLSCCNGTSRLRPDSAAAWQGPAASKRANKAVTAQQAQRGASAGTGAQGQLLGSLHVGVTREPRVR